MKVVPFTEKEEDSRVQNRSPSEHKNSEVMVRCVSRGVGRVSDMRQESRNQVWVGESIWESIMYRWYSKP